MMKIFVYAFILAFACSIGSLHLLNRHPKSESFEHHLGGLLPRIDQPLKIQVANETGRELELIGIRASCRCGTPAFEKGVLIPPMTVVDVPIVVDTCRISAASENGRLISMKPVLQSTTSGEVVLAPTVRLGFSFESTPLDFEPQSLDFSTDQSCRKLEFSFESNSGSVDLVRTPDWLAAEELDTSGQSARVPQAISFSLSLKDNHPPPLQGEIVARYVTSDLRLGHVIVPAFLVSREVVVPEKSFFSSKSNYAHIDVRLFGKGVKSIRSFTCEDHIVRNVAFDSDRRILSFDIGVNKDAPIVRQVSLVPKSESRMLRPLSFLISLNDG